MDEQTVRRIVKEEVSREVNIQLNAAFIKLFAYLDERFDGIARKHQAFEDRMDHLYGALDGHEKRLETLEQDHAAGNRQLNRHDTWIQQLASHTNTKLTD